MDELASLLHLLQFQCDAFQDLCAPSLAHLFRQLESLADELACLVKYASPPKDQGSITSLLQHGVQLCTGFLLLHGDMRGLAFAWCSRLRQQQLAGAKGVIVQVVAELGESRA